MDYVNFLRLLPAARIPLDRTERGEGDPIVLVGGDCARINPAPLAAWVDVFAMGDAEKIVPAPRGRAPARPLARGDASPPSRSVKGLYVPAVHGARAEGAEDGKIVVQQFKAAEGALREPPHTTLLTPHTELSDKLLIEIARGCSEMCRFCWAAYAMAPQVRVTAEARARDRAPEPPSHVDARASSRRPSRTTRRSSRSCADSGPSTTTSPSRP